MISKQITLLIALSLVAQNTIALSLVAKNKKKWCPESEGLPTKYDDRRFLCARVYEHSHYVENLSCGGAQRNIYNGESTSWVGDWWNDEVSSLIVRPGCRLDAYEHADYKGAKQSFEGKVWRLKNEQREWGNGWWNDKISSWSCGCDYSNAILTCTPTEESIVITHCSNPSAGSMRCQHAVTNGLSIGNSVTRGKSISNTVEASIGATFMEVFTAGLSTSTTTEYSWSKTDSKTFSKATTTLFWCDVPAYGSVNLVQVIGRCGDSVVYTSHYSCT